MTKKHVALYLRISEDKSGRVEGVRAQERWGRAYAAATWPGVAIVVYSDNDISASNGDHRPGFEALRGALARGEVAHLWCVEQSRLERREVGWFTFAAELDAAGIVEVHTRRDGIVRVLDDVAGIKAVLAAGEIRRLRQRCTDKAADLAAAGRPGGGAAYGYRAAPDPSGGRTLEVVEVEAAVIRQAAEWVLAGWSLGRIAATLRERGVVGPCRPKVRDAHGDMVTGPDGQPLTRPTRIAASTIKSILVRPTVAGLRAHKGHTVPAVWPAILDRDTWDAVRDKLAGTRRVTGRDGQDHDVNPVQRHTGRRHLLTGGTARCGVCGAPLVCVERATPSTRKPSYACHRNRGGLGCVGIVGDALESYVVGALLDALDTPAFLNALAADDHTAVRDEITGALRAVEARRSDLARMWAVGDLDASEWTAARAKLAEEEARLRGELAAVPAPLARVDPAAVRQGWEAMNLDERREIISLFVESVTVARAVPPFRPGLDTSRVAIAWRTS